jgi:hypothetical protein
MADQAKDAVKSALPKKGKIELYSPAYFAACTIGGIVACGPTHTAVTPLDLVRHIHTLSETETLTVAMDVIDLYTR